MNVYINVQICLYLPAHFSLLTSTHLSLNNKETIKSHMSNALKAFSQPFDIKLCQKCRDDEQLLMTKNGPSGEKYGCHCIHTDRPYCTSMCITDTFCHQLLIIINVNTKINYIYVLYTIGGCVILECTIAQVLAVLTIHQATTNWFSSIHPLIL